MLTDKSTCEWAVIIPQIDGENLRPSPQQALLTKEMVNNRDIAFPCARLEIRGNIDSARMQAAVVATVNSNPALTQHVSWETAQVIRPIDCTVQQSSIRQSLTDEAAFIALGRKCDSDSFELCIRLFPGSVDITGLSRCVAQITHRYHSRNFQKAPTKPELSLISDFFNRLMVEENECRSYWASQLFRQHSSPKDNKEIYAPVPSTYHKTEAVKKIPRRQLSFDDADRLQALVLHVWRQVLSAIAPETRRLAMFSSGLGADFPDLIGLLGRYVPAPTAGRFEKDYRKAIAEIREALRKLAEMTDYFPPCHIEDTGSRFALQFSVMKNVSHNLGGETEIVEMSAALQCFDLELIVRVSDDDIDISLKYDTHRYNSTAIKTIAQLLKQNLDGILTPKQLVVEETRSLIEGPKVDCPKEVDFYSEFERKSFDYGEKLATADEGCSYSYTQLRNVVEGIAALLQGKGVNPGDAVAISMKQQPLMLASILAVMRMGGYFVPVDATQPASRIRLILGEAEPRLIICDSETRLNIEGYDDLEQVDAALATKSSFQCRPSRPAKIAPSDLTYLLYTSGSSGTPKGVQISHAAFNNYIRWAADKYCGMNGCGGVVFSSIAFDMTITSLFAPLLAGGTVFFTPRDNLETLAHFLKRSAKLSFLKLTPNALDLLCDLMPADDIAKSTYHLVLGGAQLHAHSINKFERYRDLTITNEYGPTETTVGSSSYSFVADAQKGDIVPIGTPIANSQIVVVNSHGQPVPIGFSGEIAIAGRGLAKGYRKLEEMTDAAFRVFPELGSQRWYLTGDYGYLREDGQLLYEGRRDEQTKINGYRVETGEVSSILECCPVVDRAEVVVVKRGGGGGNFLSAFVKPAKGRTDAEPGMINEWCDMHLPAHARPDKIRLLDEFPVARSGKTDKAVLMEMSLKTEAGSGLGVANLEPKHELLSKIWFQLLGRKPIDHHESFFAAGGDSIKALHFVVAARRIGIRLSMADILNLRRFGKIANLAKFDDQTDHNDGLEEGKVPLLPAQQAYFDLGFKDLNKWTLSHVFFVGNDVCKDRLTKAAKTVWERHPALRTVFVHEVGTISCEISRETGWDALLEYSVKAREDFHIRRELSSYLDRVKSELDLHTGNVSRLCLLDLGNRHGYYLAMVAHHLVADPISLFLIEQEIEDLYHGSEDNNLFEDNYISFAGDRSLSQNFVFPGVSEGKSVHQLTPDHSKDFVDKFLAPEVSASRRAPSIIVTSLIRALEATEGFKDVEDICLEIQSRVQRDSKFELANTVGWLTRYQLIPVSDVRKLCSEELFRRTHLEIMSASPAVDTGTLSNIAVNYLGEIEINGEDFLPSQLSLDLSEQRKENSLFPLELILWRENAAVCSIWRYDSNQYTDIVVRVLAKQFEDEFRALFNVDGIFDPVPADFPDAELSASELERIVADFDPAKRL